MDALPLCNQTGPSSHPTDRSQFVLCAAKDMPPAYVCLCRRQPTRFDPVERRCRLETSLAQGAIGKLPPPISTSVSQGRRPHEPSTVTIRTPTPSTSPGAHIAVLSKHSDLGLKHKIMNSITPSPVVISRGHPAQSKVSPGRSHDGQVMARQSDGALLSREAAPDLSMSDSQDGLQLTLRSEDNRAGRAPSPPRDTVATNIVVAVIVVVIVLGSVLLIVKLYPHRSVIWMADRQATVVMRFKNIANQQKRFMSCFDRVTVPGTPGLRCVAMLVVYRLTGYFWACVIHSGMVLSLCYSSMGCL